MHNTLSASNYSLLNEDDFTPKPSYWGALLWRRLMGKRVLDLGMTNRLGLHVYAHCLRGTPGGVAMLVINNDRQTPSTVALPLPCARFTLATSDPTHRSITLNGMPLQLGAGDALPVMNGEQVAAGELSFAPATITFLAIPAAQNDGCR